MKQIQNTFKYFFLIFVIAGCKKTLDLTPKDQISDASFWKTPADFQLAANDFYYGLQEVPEYIDNNSDISFGTGTDVATGVDNRSKSNGSYLPQATSPLWDNSYKRIRATNYLLQKANESTLGTEIDRWVAEALFFRAYHYWNLVKAFGGVPKIDTVLDASSPELYAPRASQQEIIDFILSDLDKAEDK